ncbi:MAG: glycosyltransferase family 2 protein [Candidatus Binataceae bacterium]
MKFSLVLATRGRVVELQRFLGALGRQTYRDFELIVVDQNPDDRLVGVLAREGVRFRINHLRSEPGLSFARNCGLPFAHGDIVAFPDDDCWYSPDLLERVHDSFTRHLDAHCLSGRCIDSTGRDSHGRWDSTPGWITPFNLFRRCNSNTLFLRHLVIERVGDFDEQLGVGAETPWGSGEDTDYVLRALTAGCKAFYSPEIQVYHNNPSLWPDRDQLARRLGYSRGFGRVLRKHRYPLWLVGYHVSRPLGGLLLALIRGRLGQVRYYALASGGRLQGWAAHMPPQCSASATSSKSDEVCNRDGKLSSPTKQKSTCDTGECE